MQFSSFAIYFFLCLGVSAPCVFFVFGRLARPIAARFETCLSLPETVVRLAALCTTYFDASNPPLRSIAGSVSNDHACLECRTTGMRRPLTTFSGTLRDEGKQVVLEGSFRVPFAVKFSYSLLYALLILFGAWSACAYIVNHDQRAAGGLIPLLGIAWLGFFIAKVKTEDASSDWKWLAASINGALVNFDTMPDNDSPSAAAMDATRSRQS